MSKNKEKKNINLKIQNDINVLNRRIHKHRKQIINALKQNGGLEVLKDDCLKLEKLERERDNLQSKLIKIEVKKHFKK